jgi:hypothetical protein
VVVLIGGLHAGVAGVLAECGACDPAHEGQDLVAVLVVRRVTEGARRVVPCRPRLETGQATESALDVMLIQPRTNKHVLGPNLLAQWLWDHGATALVVSLAHPVSLEDLLGRLRPRCVGISVALSEQMGEVASPVDLVAREAPHVGIVLGGQAIETGLVEAPPRHRGARPGRAALAHRRAPTSDHLATAAARPLGMVCRPRF